MGGGVAGGKGGPVLQGEGGSACPRVLFRQRAEAVEAVPESTDPDTTSSGCLIGQDARPGWEVGTWIEESFQDG